MTRSIGRVMKSGRRQQTRQNPLKPAEPPAVQQGRREIDLPLMPVESAPKDRDGHPIVPTCWLRVKYERPEHLGGGTVRYSGEVIRVCRVEGGRDHGRLLVYVRTEDGGRWGRCAPIESVRVRRKPRPVLAEGSEKRSGRRA